MAFRRRELLKLLGLAVMAPGTALGLLKRRSKPRVYIGVDLAHDPARASVYFRHPTGVFIVNGVDMGGTAAAARKISETFYTP